MQLEELLSSAPHLGTVVAWLALFVSIFTYWRTSKRNKQSVYLQYQHRLVSTLHGQLAQLDQDTAVLSNEYEILEEEELIRRVLKFAQSISGLRLAEETINILPEGAVSIRRDVESEAARLLIQLKLEKAARRADPLNTAFRKLRTLLRDTRTKLKELDQAQLDTLSGVNP